MRRPATLLLVLTLLAAACGDDGVAPPTTGVITSSVPPGSTTTAPAEPTSTTAPEPATTAPTTTAPTTTAPTTTSAPGTIYQVDPTDFFPEVFGASGDPHGSGCITGVDALGDGVWFGFARAVAASTISFDLACFFTGPAGWAAAAADGEVGYDLDFYIRNKNPRLYSVSIAPSAQVWYVDGITITPQPIATADWPTPLSFADCPGEFCPVWLYVNGGVATGIVEQYLP